jgi:hypothetical protein
VRALDPARDGLLGRAQAGDPRALAEVEQDLDRQPESWGLIARLAGAEERLIAALAGDDALLAAALRRHLATLREELGGPAAAPLERLLAERIACCWLALQEADRRALHREGLSLAQATYYDRRLDRAQRRYLAAIKALAVVRRLGLPAVQLNVAAQQVNLAGLPGAPVAHGGRLLEQAQALESPG